MLIKSIYYTFISAHYARIMLECLHFSTCTIYTVHVENFKQFHTFTGALKTLQYSPEVNGTQSKGNVILTSGLLSELQREFKNEKTLVLHPY